MKEETQKGLVGMSVILKEMHKFAFIDFEASSLSAQSWPIEVGLSWLEDGKAAGWSSLIRPDAAWERSDWSPASEAIHNIKQGDLRAAPFADHAARALMERIGPRILISDAPEFDQRWLDRLLDTVDAAGFRTIKDFDHFTISLFDDATLDHVYERLETIRAPHRAGPDSLRMARSWERGVEVARSRTDQGMGPG